MPAPIRCSAAKIDQEWSTRSKILLIFLFLFERTLFDVRLQNVIRQLIQVRRAFLRAALAAVNLLGGHIVIGPVAAAVAVVEQKRLQIVHCVGKVRLGGLVGLKFVKTAISPRFWSSGRSE